jgi:hypothetical protein
MQYKQYSIQYRSDDMNKYTLVLEQCRPVADDSGMCCLQLAYSSCCELALTDLTPHAADVV